MKKITIFLSYASILLSLCACSHKSFIFSKNRNRNNNYRYHLVKPGDTLYSIAKKHNVKLENLVKANNIRAPHTLYKGQKLNLPRLHQQQNHNVLSKNKAYTAKKLYIPKNDCNYNQPKLVKYIDNKNWTWPAYGKIIKQFINSGPNKGNGIDIVGKKGDPIMSTASGKVVYSGNNLRGYGNLIIIKHKEDFLSAYAHNEKNLVKEQQEVAKGQQIATMGDSEANKVVLHFEVRYKGKPIDPLQVLAKR
ncbi:MAG: peptidoglycan DD-metalloendopeptidase family protein [Gammaproteobacteria bacterium]